MKRVFLIVLDSFGIGAAPDADRFGDVGANTLRSCFNTGILNLKNMISLGLSSIAGNEYLGTNDEAVGAYAKLTERSMGKDTTTGHWELAGLISDKPMPTYPRGFPSDVISQFEKLTGKKVICNKPYSGTDVIRDYGSEHIETGNLIVYTSADSVFQIAAHEDVVPVEELYRYCKIAREILTGDNVVGRVIARPFTGKNGSFVRTPNRRDFSLEPPKRTMLNAISESGRSVISVGKIYDIFCGSGITQYHLTHTNDEGMAVTSKIVETDFEGLCFVNLVDFDMVYGHRNNAVGYAKALNEFDKWLGSFMPLLHSDDILMITADHGCDPGDVSTDHTREYVPLLMYGKNVKPTDLGQLGTFSDVAASVCDYLGVEYVCEGKSFINNIMR